MTDVSVYDNNGSFVNTVKAQIAVQHGFGNGVEESCEYEVNAVQHLFYEMPIHGYAAINMSAIGPLTDMVGGVDVVALEDIKSGNSTVIKEGEEVHLEGDLAFAYIHNQDTKGVRFCGSSFGASEAVYYDVFAEGKAKDKGRHWISDFRISVDCSADCYQSDGG